MKKCNKKNGIALFATVLSIAVLLLISGGFFTVLASNTSLIKSGGDSLQAQYFAQLEADTLKLLSYEEIDDVEQDVWENFEIDENWQHKINVGPEQIIGDGENAIKIVTVDVKKSTDTIKRYSVEVPFSSQSNVLPYGTIVPYVGELEKIPHGWALCDGSNGTPDLRGQFLQGMTSQDKVKKYIAAGLPNITGEVGPIQYRIAQMQSEQGAMYIDLSGPFGSTLWENYIDSFYSNNGGEGFYRVSFDASKSNAIYGSSNTVQPPSYTVYYIMRIRAKH